MIIGATHWLVAVGLAALIHLAGMLWLSFPSPTEREDVAERSSESIVVTLGRAAREAAAGAAAVSPRDSATEVDTDTVAALDQPEVAGDAPAPDVSEARPASTVMDPEPVEPAEPVSPEAGRTETPESAASAAAPASPEPAAPPETATTEPTAPDPATAPEVAGTEPESVPAQTVSAAEPTAMRAPEIAEVSSVPEPGAREQSPEQAVAVDASVADETRVDTEAASRAPAELADSVPLPEPSRTGVSVEQAPAAGAAPANTAGVETASAHPAPDASVPVEEATTARADAPGQSVNAESVDVPAAAEPGAEVAAARQPEAEAESASEPELSEAARPETIDLQELQERSGGSGVAARYAGVLKGWLQKNMHYPRAARLAGQEGKVVVRFVIDRAGNVQSIELESKSGFPLLDREAKEMIERGNPFPGIPEDMPGQRLEVRVPVDFHVRDETLTKEIPPIYLD